MVGVSDNMKEGSSSIFIEQVDIFDLQAFHM